MIKSTYPLIDASIFEQSSSMNTGIDSILELSKISSSAGVFTSRILIKFPLEEISASVASGKISNPSFYLNLYQSETSTVPRDYTLICHPLSQSWANGAGRTVEPTKLNGVNREGVSWTYRNKQSDRIEYMPSKDLQWTSRSLHIDSEMVYSNVTGGGTWYKNYFGTQSFSGESSDVRMDITPVIRYLLTGSRSNDGVILKRSGSQETNTDPYGNIKFFSRETNTVYQPRLEIVYDDSSFNSTGLSELISDQGVVYVKNLKHEYSNKETPKIRVLGRPRYPVKTFSTQSNFKNIDFLPTSSYYSIKDALTDEFIVPYSSKGTKLSCDENGNYFNLDMSSFMRERYYKLCFQVTQSDQSVVVYDENFYFKVR
jgi:hypothetical protein|tara:strand:+ start:11018 stop:12130 length:1113 start_codon:yes stop_codon:yes gene_type:complete